MESLSPTRISVATGQLDPSIDTPVTLSSGDAWKDLRLDQRTLPPTEQQEGYLKHHSVLFHIGPPVRFEISWPGDRPVTTVMRPGAAIVVPAGVPYRARWDQTWELLCVRLRVEGAARITPATFHSPFRPAIPDGDALLCDLALALRNEALAGPRGTELYAETLGSAMLAHLVRRYGTPSGETSRRGGLRRRQLNELRDYVEEHLDAALHLSQLAELAGASVRQFGRAFKQSTNLTPHQFVLLRRIERAKTLLAESRMAVGEIAVACGFASQSRFTSAFRRITRTTPTEYRSARG